MSKRITIASILCLTLGTSSVIAAPIADQGIVNLIEDLADEFLLDLREEVQPFMEDLFDMTNFVNIVGLQMYVPAHLRLYLDTYNIPNNQYYFLHNVENSLLLQ